MRYVQFANSVTVLQNGVTRAETLQLTVTHERDVMLNLQCRSRNVVRRKITEVNTRDKGKTAVGHAWGTLARNKTLKR
jgi:hypothetical protein